MLPLCERVFVFDDSSADGTPEICGRIGDCVTVYRSEFSGLDERRDKQFLLDKIMELVPAQNLAGDPTSPYWICAFDGDEVLAPGGQSVIKQFCETAPGAAAKLPIRYLWDDREHYRVDGVYEHFARPSLFRLMNRNFRFQSTPWGGNMHCSSIPQELLHHAHVAIDAPLLHLGYMDKADRLRKYEWYNLMDPNNAGEDFYRHMVVGDIFPADSCFRHGGPLQLRAIA